MAACTEACCHAGTDKAAGAQHEDAKRLLLRLASSMPCLLGSRRLLRPIAEDEQAPHMSGHRGRRAVPAQGSKP